MAAVTWLLQQVLSLLEESDTKGKFTCRVFPWGEQMQNARETILIPVRFASYAVGLVIGTPQKYGTTNFGKPLFVHTGVP